MSAKNPNQGSPQENQKRDRDTAKQGDRSQINPNTTSQAGSRRGADDPDADAQRTRGTRRDRPDVERPTKDPRQHEYGDLGDPREPDTEAGPGRQPGGRSTASGPSSTQGAE